MLGEKIVREVSAGQRQVVYRDPLGRRIAIVDLVAKRIQDRIALGSGPPVNINALQEQFLESMILVQIIFGVAMELAAEQMPVAIFQYLLMVSAVPLIMLVHQEH